MGTPAVAGHAAVSAVVAEQIAYHAQLISTLETVISSLKDVGAMQTVINLENELIKERRRIRSFGQRGR